MKRLLLPGFLLANILTGCGSSEPKTASAGTEVKEENGFKSIFDGKSLEGWEYDEKFWRVENGTIVGEITPETEIKTNTFLIWKGGEPSNFELKLEYTISDNGNSGVQYRSERVADVPFALKGYQADIDGKNNYTGQNYEERARTTLAYMGQRTTIPTSDTAKSFRNAWNVMVVNDTIEAPDAIRASIKANDWNEIHIVASGNNLKHYVNGKLVSEVTDDDVNNRKEKGLLGVQVHVGPPMKVELRNIQIKNL